MPSLVIVMLTAALIGCASPGTSRSLAPGDLAMLAGTWNGTVTPPSASTSISGGLATAQRTSRASLSEGPGGMLVLSGFGHSDSGPFNFEVTRKK